MTHDVVIIPTFSRPEFLWACLDRLAACPEVGNVKIWVVADHHLGHPPAIAEITRVVERFAHLPIVLTERWPHEYDGNSFNVLEAYRQAFETGCEFVFQLEDDVLVSPDFLTWHYRTQAAGDWFCSVSCKNPFQVVAGDAGDYYTSAGDFSSYGVCFNRQSLAEILEHARPEYYGRMTEYVVEHFPNSVFGLSWTEQDGLIRRVLMAGNRPAAWSTVPRSQHAGWYGYHRGNGPRPGGHLEQRYQRLLDILNTPGEIERLSVDFNDLEPLHV